MIWGAALGIVASACAASAGGPAGTAGASGTRSAVDEDAIPARIVVWTGYGTPERVIVRGRVIADPPASSDPEDGMFANVATNLDTLESDEVKFAALEVAIGGRRLGVMTDEDGLFYAPLQLSPLPLQPGRHPITVSLVEKPGVTAPPGAGEVRIVGTDARVAMLSDFDDTVVQSFVTSKPRLLFEVLTKNAAQLEPVQGANLAYREAADAGVDIFFYLSGSPIQLHERIVAFLERHDFPKGPLLLKNLGDDPLFAQLEYKVGRIEALLDTLPQLRFILVGDSGEKDPEVYRAVREKHPDRVAAIVIRRAPGADDNPARFPGMTVVDDYRGQAHVLAALVTAAKALPPPAPPTAAR